MDAQKNHVVIVDGMNFLHRARAGFAVGDSYIIFNFFRNLRALVEKLQPTRLCFVLEGKPITRLTEYPEYKANRKITDDDPEAEAKRDAQADFYRQTNIAIDLLKENFPVSVMRHPNHECDDVIYNIILSSSRMVDFTVVSNDTDMIQLLNEFENVRVYNPMKKDYQQAPEYDYVIWKSLRGDGSDNIPGIPGVGDVKAEKLASDPDGLKSWLLENKATQRFADNYKLIKFHTFSKEEMLGVSSSIPKRDWENVKTQFTERQFNSIINDKSWNKFTSTFEPLFGEYI